MKVYKNLVLLIGLGGLAGSMTAMEEKLKKLGLQDDIKIKLKNREEVAIASG